MPRMWPGPRCARGRNQGSRNRKVTPTFPSIRLSEAWCPQALPSLLQGPPFTQEAPQLQHVGLQCVCVSCSEVSDSLQQHGLIRQPCSSVHVIVQWSILEWVGIFSSRGCSRPSDWIWISCVAGRFITVWPSREAQAYGDGVNSAKLPWPICPPDGAPSPLVKITPRWLRVAPTVPTRRCSGTDG